MHRYSYKEKVAEGEARLRNHRQEAGIATLAMEDLFSISRTTLLLSAMEAMPAEAVLRYDDVISQVCGGRPYQYAVGFSWFYGERFKVTEDTLIPRNETEELVHLILKEEDDDDRVVVDIGTGTGIIPITLKHHWHTNTVYGTDISSGALRVAADNIERHQSEVRLIHGELFEPLILEGVAVDILISNPPYIAYGEEEWMTASTVEHEPRLALFAEDQGLAVYKRMIEGLPDVLKPGGTVYFEIGFRQRVPLERFVRECWPQTTPCIKKDLNGNDRILYFKWEG